MKQSEQNADGKKGTSTKERILWRRSSSSRKKGYSGVSVRDITREVGINEGSMYNHFKNKEALLGAIFDYFKFRGRRRRFSVGRC